VGVFYLKGLWGTNGSGGILSGNGVLRIKIIQTKMRTDDKVDKCVLHTKNPDRFQTTRDGEVLECG
jgi:hypothetical protein